MDRRVFFILSAVVIASGCAHGDIAGSTVSDDGLVVEEFTTSDSELHEGQSAVIEAYIRNYNDEETEIHDISLFNTGDLEVGERSCSPSPEELGHRTRDLVPDMECSWTVETEGLEGFESKNIPVSLNLEYSTALRSEPVVVHFRPLEDVERTGTVERSFSNGDITKTISTESPVAYGQDGNFDIAVQNSGSGSVKSESYRFDYSPSEVFDQCEEEQSEVDLVIGSEVDFSCPISLDGDGTQTTRNLQTTTHYKYAKQPSLNIRVVNQ